MEMEQSSHSTVGLRMVLVRPCRFCINGLFAKKVPFCQKTTYYQCKTVSFPCPTEKASQGIFNQDTFARVLAGSL